MKTLTRRALALGTTLALAAGTALVTTAPASAASDKSATGTETAAEGLRTKVRVTTKDVKIKKGKFTTKDWMTIAVDVPEPYRHSDGSVVASEWTVTITPRYTATSTCAKGGTLPGGGERISGDLKLTLPALKSRGLEKKSSRMYLYHGAGRCIFDITVDVTRDGDYTQGIPAYYDTVKVSGVTVDNLAPSKSTISSPTKGKKNKSFTVSGKATFQNPKDRFKAVSVKKGAKVQVQFRKNGKGPWKTIKTTKVGSKGVWKAKVKLPAKGKIRAVVGQTKTSQAATTKARSISVTKK